MMLAAVDIAAPWAWALLTPFAIGPAIRVGERAGHTVHRWNARRWERR